MKQFEAVHLFMQTMPDQPWSRLFLKQLKVKMSRGPFRNYLVWISYNCAESSLTNVEYATSNLNKRSWTNIMLSTKFTWVYDNVFWSSINSNSVRLVWVHMLWLNVAFGTVQFGIFLFLVHANIWLMNSKTNENTKRLFHVKLNHST